MLTYFFLICCCCYCHESQAIYLRSKVAKIFRLHKKLQAAFEFWIANQLIYSAYDSKSVVLTDMVGFTSYCQARSAEEVLMNNFHSLILCAIVTVLKKLKPLAMHFSLPVMTCKTMPIASC